MGETPDPVNVHPKLSKYGLLRDVFYYTKNKTAPLVIPKHQRHSLPLHLPCTPMDLARISESVLNLHCICADLAGDAISTRAGPAGPQGGGDGQALAGVAWSVGM